MRTILITAFVDEDYIPAAERVLIAGCLAMEDLGAQIQWGVTVEGKMNEPRDIADAWDKFMAQWSLTENESDDL